jgi:hypothetical protein
MIMKKPQRATLRRAILGAYGPGHHRQPLPDAWNLGPYAPNIARLAVP